MTRCLATLVLGATLLLAACGRAAAPVPSTEDTPLTRVPNAFVGAVVGTEVLLALVPREGSLQVYACDAADLSTPTVSQWFSGAFTGTGPVTLTADGLSVTVRRAGDGFAGEFVGRDGRAAPFTATLATGASGLYDAELRDAGTVVRDGDVIVLGDRARGTFVSPRPPPRSRLGHHHASAGPSR